MGELSPHSLRSGQSSPQHRLEGIGLTDKAEIVGMRAVGGAFGVVAEQSFAGEVMDIFHAGGNERIIGTHQSRAAGGVALTLPAFTQEPP